MKCIPVFSRNERQVRTVESNETSKDNITTCKSRELVKITEFTNFITRYLSLGISYARIVSLSLS